MFYSLAADAVAIVHLSYMLFVVLGLVLVFLGKLLRWTWVRNAWFRSLHLLAILVVVVESLLSITCPLTTLEDLLRRRAGQTVQDGSFVGRWAHDILFIDLSPQAFTIIYCLFGLVVLLSWIIVPPSILGKPRKNVELLADQQ